MVQLHNIKPETRTALNAYRDRNKLNSQNDAIMHADSSNSFQDLVKSHEFDEVSLDDPHDFGCDYVCFHGDEIIETMLLIKKHKGADYSIYSAYIDDARDPRKHHYLGCYSEYNAVSFIGSWLKQEA